MCIFLGIMCFDKKNLVTLRLSLSISLTVIVISLYTEENFFINGNKKFPVPTAGSSTDIFDLFRIGRDSIISLTIKLSV